MRFIIIPLLFFSVRLLTPGLEGVLDAGYRNSLTFRALVDALEQSDVVVYVTTGTQAAGVIGTTQFVARGGATRYLRVTLAREVNGDAAVALLGHELQHALEIANAGSVVDARSVEALYRAEGECVQVGPVRRYDTPAARDVERRVLTEIRKGRLRASR